MSKKNIFISLILIGILLPIFFVSLPIEAAEENKEPVCCCYLEDEELTDECGLIHECPDGTKEVDKEHKNCYADPVKVWLQVPFGPFLRRPTEGLTDYIKELYVWIVRAVGAIAVLVIMISGFMWMVAAGNQSIISNARARIISAIVGIILVYISYFILAVINPDLVKLKPIRIYKILGIPQLSGGDFVGIPGEGLTPPFDEFFKQCDQRWGNTPYQPLGGHSTCKGNETICTSGCGVAATATVINKKLGVNVGMIELVNYAKKVGARKNCTDGTYVNVLAPKLEKWGVSYKAITCDVKKEGHQNALKFLREDKWLVGAIQNYVTTGGKEIFTGGHFVVFYGISGNKVLIKDPYKTNIESLPIENNKIKYAKSTFYYLTKKE